MKSQSAPDASADTKARYLETRWILLYNLVSTRAVAQCTSRCAKDLKYCLCVESGDPWFVLCNSPTVSAHNFQNKSALVAVKSKQR